MAQKGVYSVFNAYGFVMGGGGQLFYIAYYKNNIKSICQMRCFLNFLLHILE